MVLAQPLSPCSLPTTTGIFAMDHQYNVGILSDSYREDRLVQKLLI